MSATDGGKSLHFKKGDKVDIRVDDFTRTSNNKTLLFDYLNLTTILSVGERITFEGGMVADVKEVVLDEVRIEFKHEGEIKSQAYVRLEGKRYEFMPLLRNEDKEAL